MTDTLITAATIPEGETQAVTPIPAAADLPQTLTPEPAPPEGEEAPAEQAEPEGAPETYEDFELPEGVSMDSKTADIFKSAAKDLGLSQEKANKFASQMLPAIRAHQAEVLTQARTEWADSARGDKEFGGDRLEANVAISAKALQQFGTPELSKFLADTGLGNHPEFIRAFYRAGKAISEDRVVTGGDGLKAPVSGPTSDAQKAAILYPNQK